MLRIGVVGFNLRITKEKVIPLIRHMEQTEGKFVALTKNGRFMLIADDENTEYIFLVGDPYKYCGMLFDQLIICDDERWNVLCEQHDLILQAKYQLKRSFVPEEFQVIKLPLFEEGVINHEQGSEFRRIPGPIRKRCNKA